MGPYYENMFDVSQYGVNMPQSSDSEDIRNMSSLISLIPYVGPILGAIGNFASTYYQNREQEYMYNKYMSPAARMAQMRAAGINPNAAAQGIAGASPAQMNAAPMSSAFTGIGEQLGNSANTALTAQAIKAGISKTEAETNLTNSLNVEKQTTNKYLDAMQSATLKNLVNQGTISSHQANMIAVDDYYKGAEAAAHWEQTLKSLDIMSNQIKLMEQEYYNKLAEEYATLQSAALSEAQIHKVFSDIGLNNAQIERISHECANIDANTAATYQNITESQARTQALSIQNEYNQKVNNIWNDTGWNINSDVNANFQQLVMSGDIDGATRLMKGMDAYIRGTGISRAHSNDFRIEQLVGVFGGFSRIVAH